jgi:hypothetical protein
MFRTQKIAVSLVYGAVRSRVRIGSFSLNFLTLAVNRFEETVPPWVLRGCYFPEIYRAPSAGKQTRTRRSLPMELSKRRPAYALTRDATIRLLDPATCAQ